MTKDRTYSGGTEFSMWLREQPELDSSKGYITTDVDYVWVNANTDEFMLIEEKRYGWFVKGTQQKVFRILNAACKHDKNYRGYHLLTFENTNPQDGGIHLNNKDITTVDLIRFLQFDLEIISRYRDADEQKPTQKFTPKIVQNLNKIR
jgi:hypothetical protein